MVSAKKSEASGSRIETETSEERDEERDERSTEAGPAEKEIQSREAEPDEGEIQIFDYFARPKSKDLSLFFQYHPQQTPRRALPSIFHTRDGVNRKWLTYCEESHALFCTVCLAFSKPSAFDSALPPLLEEACNPGSMFIKE